MSEDSESCTMARMFYMKVGFVGGGPMGARIVSRLLTARDILIGWNRTPEKVKGPLQEGMKWADNPRERASQRNDECLPRPWYR